MLTNVSIWTRQMDRGRCVFCQKDSSAPLLDSCRNRDNTVCGHVNLKNNLDEFQRGDASFSVRILVHLNELQEQDQIIQCLMEIRAKRHKIFVLDFSVSR